MRGAGRVAGILEDGEVVVVVALAVVEVDKHRIDGLPRGRVDEVAVVPLSPTANDGEIDGNLEVEGVLVDGCLAVIDDGVVDFVVSLSRGRGGEVTAVPLSPAANDGEIDEDLGVEGVVGGECLAAVDEGVLDFFVSFIFSLRAWFGDGGFSSASIGTSTAVLRSFVLSNASYLLWSLMRSAGSASRGRGPRSTSE